jgi:hypothetical protein
MGPQRFLAPALGATIGVMVTSLAPAEIAAQEPTPAALFRESSAAARRIPPTDTTRTDLLRRIAEALIWVGDIDSALAISRSLGPWRREVQNDATCRLLEEHRFDDAYKLVRDFPDEDRDWALATLAVKLAQPARFHRPTPPGPIDTIALRDRALTIAHEIRTPAPRVDAFLEIGNRFGYQRDMARRRVAIAEALVSLPALRDRDLASSRLRGIIDNLADLGHVDSALALLPRLLPGDRITAARRIGQWRDARDPRIRSELLALASRAERVADPQLRLALADGIVEAFNTPGDSATADSIAARLRSDPTVGRGSRQRASAALSIVERAVQLAPNDFHAALALVDTLDDPFSYGRRARALARVAHAAPRANADTAAVLLRQARELALGRGLSSRQLSLTLLEIAKAQVGRGLADEGAATLRAIPDRAIALAAVSQYGQLKFEFPRANGQRFFAALVGDDELRAAAAARVIDASVANKNAPEADYAWAVGVADSLPRNRWAEPAQNLIARTAFFRGDTAAARDRALSTLRARDRDWTRWQTYLFRDELLFWVVRTGGLGDALAWARALPSTASRAAGLLALGEALDDVTNIGSSTSSSRSMHGCRDDF